jgi:hypothetical protein
LIFYFRLMPCMPRVIWNIILRSISMIRSNAMPKWLPV